MTIRHVVTWRLAAADEADRAAHADEIVRRLTNLVGVVPSILSLTAGAESLYVGTNWDVVLIADFADQEGLEAYQVHPAHKEAGAFIRSVVADRVAVDFHVD
ncbi:Dabb family protein [Microbacterium sp. NC79]|uniref:Dabb family protein n=1 Tax=Microbacterium sp. NC79 TaxID=2851009 RepID=UPI001C2C1408|nr:Dabb family protein [Microbacterium sp. NC79]MBV0893979.1 Dabb family protein [Microbacterium sp. NC79]